MSAPPDPAVCPLCGDANVCARAADPEAETCWCRAETFPPSLLARVPAAAQGKACICPRCLRAAQERAQSM